MIHHNNQYKTQAGFALLITLLVISVVIAVMLAIVELSLKQLALSVNSTGSEIAFQAANAGLECARFIRRSQSIKFETTPFDTMKFQCFGKNKSPVVSNVDVATNQVNPLTGGTGTVYRYQVDLDWGGGTGARCSEVDMVAIVMDITSPANGVLGSAGANTLRNIFPNYTSDTKACSPGSRCTIASVIGYNSSCANKRAVGTLRREILLEF